MDKFLKEYAHSSQFDWLANLRYQLFYLGRLCSVTVLIVVALEKLCTYLIHRSDKRLPFENRKHYQLRDSDTLHHTSVVRVYPK